MHTKSITELSRLLAAKKISSVELSQCFAERISQHNPTLNALITQTQETALEAAKQADNRLAKGEDQPLTGIPLVHKDIFCTQGVKTTCGSKMLDNFIAPYESTVTEKFKQAGSVMLGKTNMDEFAMGSSNESSFYGAVKNPWDLSAVAGGSSGGSAAAVAAALAPGATGTDTGGSVRQPASHCGISGLKPTYGRVSRWGMIAYGSSLDQAGVMAYHAEDLALMLQVIAGFDCKDSTSAKESVPNFSADLSKGIAGLKIGLPKEYFTQGLDPSVEKIIRQAVKEFEAQGAVVKEMSLPNLELSIPAYYVIASAEASSNLSRYDGVRYGHRCDAPKDLQDLYCRSRSEGFGAEVKRRILVGTYALSAGYYDAYYLQAQKLRRLIQNDFLQAFKEVDVIMGPNAPTAAFDLGSKNTNPVEMYLSDAYTIAANLAGLPGISLPAGFVNQRPVGLQILAPFFAEPLLLQCGYQFQQATCWHKQRPTAFSAAN